MGTRGESKRIGSKFLVISVSLLEVRGGNARDGLRWPLRPV